MTVGSRCLAWVLILAGAASCGSEKESASRRSGDAAAIPGNGRGSDVIIEDGEGAPVKIGADRDGDGIPDVVVVGVDPDGGETIAGSGANAGGNGTSVGGTDGGETDVGASGGPVNSYADCKAPGFKAAGVRRLSAFEWPRTLTAVTGIAAAQLPDMATISDPEEDGFRNVGDRLRVTRLHAEGYLAQAEALSESLMTVGVASIVPESCKASGGARSCAVNLIAGFGAKAFRRPLTTAESAALAGIYDDLVGDIGHVDAMRGVIEAVLQVPQVLYRTELSAELATETAHEVTLDPYEVASELSYALTASPPDASLLAAAADGRILEAKERRAQADRLMASAAFGDVGAEFLTSWLSLRDLDLVAKDAAAYPQFDDTVRAAMGEESIRLARAIFAPGGMSKPGSVLTADYTFVNPTLASYYGMSSVSGWQKVTQATGRSGILGQGAFLTARAAPGESSPIKRGSTVARRLLCVALPDPPSNVPPLTPEATTGEMTTRERIAEHTTNAACSGCHSLMDPLGFSLEHFDGVGAYRAMQHGKPIDATGMLARLDGIEVKFQEWTELAGEMAASADYERCFTRELFRFTAGVPNVREDLCRAEKIRTAAGTEPSIAALLVAMVSDDAFVRRRFEP